MACLLASRFVCRVLSRKRYISVNVRTQQTHAAIQKKTVNDNKSVTPVFKHAVNYGERIALKDCHGEYTYKGIFLSSRQLSAEFSERLKGKQQERIAFLCPNDGSYIIAQWACWMSGQIAVPLSTIHPPEILQYFVNDSDAGLLVTTPEYSHCLEEVAKKTGRQLMILDDALRVLAMRQPQKLSVLDSLSENEESEERLDGGLEPEFYSSSDAMIVYTSGSTGSPKGVVINHSSLESQIVCLLKAWEWSKSDIILHTLPLNHVHGIINALLCPLYIGAKCLMHPKFETSKTWSTLLAINTPHNERPNVYMAVPTIYVKLIDEFDRIFANDERKREYVKAVCSKKMRLMVSGSSPLPVPTFDRWEEITGHKLLERYGMSETGMVLSNPLQGERKPGFVGLPLPGVEVCIKNIESGSEPKLLVKGNSTENVVVDQPKSCVGMLYVKGPNVFKQYFRRPKATEKEFSEDGWFKTGDIAEYLNGSYRILGRMSVDIIKTGGYKVSALEVETHLLGHPDIVDCAVIGLPDITWGQKVAAVVVPVENTELILSEIRKWSKSRMAPYCVPTVLKVLEKIPRNNLGKVNKKELLQEIFPELLKEKKNLT